MAKKDEQVRPQSFNPLSSYGIILAYLIIPFRRQSFRPLVSFLITVVRDFFWLQFSVKFGLRKIPVISVDHKIDAGIPFVPQKVDIYLDFVNFWIRPMSFLFKRLGVKKALPFCVEYLNLITKTYSEAARMYRFRMSTTIRPPCPPMLKFRIIRLMDPHYLCVPSLHVAVVNLAYTYYRALFAQLNFTREEQDFYNAELYKGAQAISETVLYVKQHSVNCIPAALYMLLHILPEKFSVEQAVKSIDGLFCAAPDINLENKKQVTEHIHFMFERLLLEGCNEDDWIIPVQRWILQYEKLQTKTQKAADRE